MSSEQGVAVREQEEMSVAELRQRLPELKEKAELVREFQRSVLRDGIDYGPIPGAGRRDVLLKPGAESLLAWHNFDTPDADIEKEDHDWTTGFHYYVMRVTVRSQKGRHYTAVRAASSFEKKWRYDRDGNERSVKDMNSQVDNVLAMASKRALVAVTRLATATSGLFDEEFEEEKPAQKPQPKAEPPADWKAKAKRAFDGWKADHDKDGSILSALLTSHKLKNVEEIADYQKALSIYEEYQQKTKQPKQETLV